MVDLQDCNIKLDHSLGCPDDSPNWRRVPGFPIFGVGQPTLDGFDKVKKGIYMTSRHNKNLYSKFRLLVKSPKTRLFGSIPDKSQWPMLMDSLSLPETRRILMVTLTLVVRLKLWIIWKRSLSNRLRRGLLRREDQFKFSGALLHIGQKCFYYMVLF